MSHQLRLSRTSVDGTLTIAGSVELDMSLPCFPDNNADAALVNYGDAPDYYAHAFGAKVWLVPSACYDEPTKTVTTWTPTDFLFESDLITYIDTDCGYYAPAP